MFFGAGKPRWFARTSWWWTQSLETGLRRADSLETGKGQGISSQNAREAKIAGDFPPLNQWLVEQFPANQNRELNRPSRERISQDQGLAAAGRELSGQ